MRSLTFWKLVTMDRSDLLERLIGLLTDSGAAFCVIGGQGVNAYAEPLVSLDLDLVVATADLPRVEELLAREFIVHHFPFSLNVSTPDSDLRVQIQKDPRYSSFPERSSRRELLGLWLPIAAVEDVLQGKIWAVQDPTRRPSKRRKDLLDIERLLDNDPSLRERVPDEILARLQQ